MRVDIESTAKAAKLWTHCKKKISLNSSRCWNQSLELDLNNKEAEKNSQWNLNSKKILTFLPVKLRLKWVENLSAKRMRSERNSQNFFLRFERSSSYIFRRQKIIHFLDRRDTAELAWSDLSLEKTWEWGKDDIGDMENEILNVFSMKPYCILPQLILFISHHPLLSALLCCFDLSVSPFVARFVDLLKFDLVHERQQQQRRFIKPTKFGCSPSSTQVIIVVVEKFCEFFFWLSLSPFYLLFLRLFCHCITLTLKNKNRFFRLTPDDSSCCDVSSSHMKIKFRAKNAKMRLETRVVSSILLCSSILFSWFAVWMGAMSMCCGESFNFVFYLLYFWWTLQQQQQPGRRTRKYE